MTQDGKSYKLLNYIFLINTHKDKYEVSQTIIQNNLYNSGQTSLWKWNWAQNNVRIVFRERNKVSNTGGVLKSLAYETKERLKGNRENKRK